ncbi:alpha/beta fold hydrolase [Baekduia sp.]|uniref:alpha/beta fold hydrolase n=1 Tax=Baekduia sp. TaxID=2600305 RepID=UPI002D78B48A|nr:alpha/beta fold hydrolase [Baekduia sp.]
MSVRTVYIPPVGLDAGSWWLVPEARDGVLHELPGFGSARRADVQPTMGDLADALVEAHDGALHLVGVSMGGMVALHAAARHPDRVVSVLVACTGARANPDTMLARAAAAESGGMAAVLDSTLARWFTPRALATPGHPGVRYARRTLLALEPGAYADGWRAIATHDVTPWLGELRVPVTAVAGACDTASPKARSAAIAERVPGGRLVVVDDAPHMIHLERPRQFSAVVREHLARAMTSVTD